MKRAARALAAFASLVLACCSIGCAGSFLRPSGDAEIASYEALSEPRRLQIVEARKLADQGDLEPALALARVVRAAHEDNVNVGALVQELELALAPPDEREAALARLEAEGWSAAEASPSATRWLLAARVTRDHDRARRAIDSALALEPRNARAHYARAHVEVREGRWAEASEHLARALELDPFDVAARRMQAAFLARNGKSDDAIEAYEAWLEDTEGDSRVSRAERAGARLDLASLLVLAGEPDDARAVLDQIEGADDVRELCIRAAIEQARERPRAALEAAQRAAELDERAALPWVQLALLHEHWLEDPAGARDAWQRLLADVESRGDVSALLLAMRARVALERAPAASSPPTR